MRQLDVHALSTETTHVFPSEVAAAFWRREFLTSHERRAIREDEVISWDTFKEQLFARHTHRPPVNRIARTLFSRWLTETNAREPFLRGLVAEPYAAQSTLFSRDIERLLPSLHRLHGSHGAQLGDDFSSDIAEIYRRYKRFLDDHELFEPTWESEATPAEDAAGSGSARYTVHFPPVIEDYAEFSAALERLPNVGTRPIPEAPQHELYELSNAHEELAWLVAELERLLDDGIPPHRIAVTVGDADSYLPYLHDLAGRRHVPLAPRHGKVLTDYPGGRLFSLLSELAATDFSLDAVKAFLLNRALPLRDRGAARALVRIGVDAGVVRRTVSVGRDEWERALRAKLAHAIASHGDESADGALVNRALSLYRELAARVPAVTGAGSFEELRRELYRLFRAVLDTNAWDRPNLLAFQRCMELLASCIEQSRSGTYRLDSPFSLWLSLLGNQIYVAREDAVGVPVYPYRVAAGILPDYHFVVNCSNDATRALSRQWSFLREDQREQLGLGSNDMTDSFLRLYASSGMNVRFSYARDGFAGAQIAPFLFVGEGAIVNAADGAAGGSYDGEPRLWGGAGGELPQRLYPQQIAGASYMALTGFQERSPDFGVSAVADSRLFEQLRERFAAEDDPGRIRLSATDLARYISCPFSYFLQRCLQVSEEEYGVDQDDARLIGTLYHDVLERLFLEIREEDEGVFRREQLQRYREIAEELLAAVISGSFSRSSRLLPPVRFAVVYRLRRALVKLLEDEAEIHDGHQILREESWHRTRLADPMVELVGRLDRLMRNPESGALVLVDYKRKALPKKRELGVEAPEESLAAMQLPLYALLLATNGAKLERLLYFSVENEAWQRVYDAGSFPASTSWHTEESWNAVVEEVRRRIGYAAAGIGRGDFRFPTPEHGCESCVFRGICRTKFRVR